MGTHDFKADISAGLRRYIQQNPEKSPSVLKLNYMDALTWYDAGQSKVRLADFVEHNVKPYVRSLRVNKNPLVYSIELLNVEANEPTRFE